MAPRMLPCFTPILKEFNYKSIKSHAAGSVLVTRLNYSFPATPRFSRFINKHERFTLSKATKGICLPSNNFSGL